MLKTAGQVVWMDAVVADREAAQAFYGAVVGWGIQGFDHGTGVYPMWLVPKGDHRVGGIMDAVGGEAPRWQVYVQVEDVDAAVAHAVELGASVVTAPVHMGETGAYAVIADPFGAVIGVYASSNTDWDVPERDLGHLDWMELGAPDLDAAMAFYGALFGWTIAEDMDMGDMGIYRMFKAPSADRSLGGLFVPPPGMPTSWLPYFRVASVDDIAPTIAERGGRVMMGPMDVPGGTRIVMAVDPQGASFGLTS